MGVAGRAAGAIVSGFDPVELEILWGRLIAALDEMETVVVKTTFSTILRESRDFAVILTDAGGRSMCQSTLSTATFAAVFPRTAKELLARFPLDTLRPGDVLATNDPWLGTGHLPDYILLTPVFHRGRPVACVGSVAHVSDVGGHPGEIEGEDVYAEGLRMPPCKLVEEGRENRLAFDLIGANARAPELLLGDLRAMIGAARVGARGVTRFLDSAGLTDLEALSSTVLERSERHMRASLEALPDGVYQAEMEIDGYVDTVRLVASVTIDGGHAVVDYAGTSRLSPYGAINVPFGSTLATTIYPFKCALAPEVPNNEGLFRPIEVRAPEGCILNAPDPSAVKARAKTTNNLNQVLFAALWPVLGEHVNASNGGIWPFVLKGEEPGHGRYLVDMLPHGGRGGQPTLDGMVPVSYPNNSAITPCEVLEADAPVRFLEKALRPDSAGPGRHRGGLGQTIAFRHVGRAAMTLSLTPDRITTPPIGLAGGADAPPGRVLINGVEVDRFPPIRLEPGDEVVLELPGGGGFGSPSQRLDAEIDADIAAGYLSEAGRAPYRSGPDAVRRDG
jgi:N-methylhydantoinase B